MIARARVRAVALAAGGLLAALVGWLILFPAAAQSADKSGVRPQVINLPSGPGSVHGLGESFQPQLNTGTAGYRVSLAVPPGAGGHTPVLDLVYDGGQANGPFGLGWRLDLPSIQRQTDKGLPLYGDQDRFVYGAGSELVPLADGTYRLRVEGAFTRFRRLGESWEATEKDGTRWLFGETAAGRQVNPLGTFLWQPQRGIDTNGNEIRLFYAQDGGQLYLTEIRYNTGRSAPYGQEPPGSFAGVLIEYETRPNPLHDYRSRSLVRTAWRARAIEVKVLGQLARRYELGYDDSSGISLLTEVRQLGTDGARFENTPTGALPPLRLTYSTFNPASATNVPMTTPPLVKIGSPNADLVDINGDALPDVVVTDPSSGHRFYLNIGRGRWAAQPVYPAMTPTDKLETPGVQVADMDGDGRADLLVKTGIEPTASFYYYPNLGGSAWELTQLVNLGSSPPFTFEDANVRLVDLDNDKRIDVLRTTASPTGSAPR